MADCHITINCAAINQTLLDLIQANSSLASSACDRKLACTDKLLLIHRGYTLCLTGICHEEEESQEFPVWAKPITCAAIVVIVFIFFSVIYFGKSYSDNRSPKGRKQEQVMRCIVEDESQEWGGGSSSGGQAEGG